MYKVSKTLDRNNQMKMHKIILFLLLLVFACVVIVLPVLHNDMHCHEEHCPLCAYMQRMRENGGIATFLITVLLVGAVSGTLILIPQSGNTFSNPIFLHVQLNN